MYYVLENFLVLQCFPDGIIKFNILHVHLYMLFIIDTFMYIDLYILQSFPRSV